MLHEVELKRALQAYLDGKEVKVILPMDEDEDRVIPFRKLFNGARFLVDRSPAVINQGFDDAIREAMSNNTEGMTSEPSENAEKPEDKPVAAGPKRKPIDTGKLMALHNAGWPSRKIADELKVSPSTVLNYLKKMEGKTDEV